MQGIVESERLPTCFPKCALCKERVDTECPSLEGGVYEHNPETFRLAWMHGYCYQNACEELKHTPSKVDGFDNELDRYLAKFA